MASLFSWWCRYDDARDAAAAADRGKRDDIDEEDDQESYFRYMEENPMAGVINDEDDNIEYDEDGNAIIPEKKVTVVYYIYASSFYVAKMFQKYVFVGNLFWLCTHLLWTKVSAAKFHSFLCTFWSIF